MKRIITAVFVFIMLMVLICGCANNNQQASPSPSIEQSPPGGETDEVSPVSGVRTGFGCDISIKKSAGASKDAQGNTVNALAQADMIIASVTLDEQDTIIGIKFDSAQTRINFDDKGNLVTDVAVKQQTKKELADQYGMKQASGIGKEWYEQAEALEDWMSGRTVTEVLNMNTAERDAAHPAVPDEPDLTSSVTITVDGFLRALQKAVDNADETVQASGMTKTGLGVIISVTKSKGVTAGDDGSTDALGQSDVTMAAVTVDENKKIIGIKIDQAQTKITFNAQGVLTTDTAAEQKTKVELGDAYGMKKASPIGKEWYEQAAALEEWIKGKTIDEAMAMKTTQGGDHPGAPEEADLTSSVTITVTDLLAAVEKAVANASWE